MDDATKLAVQLNDRARARSTQRRIRRAQLQAVRQRAGSATYVGFDADSEKCTVRTASGELIEGAYISNSGAAPGDRVAFTRGVGGAFIKAIPR